MAYNVMADYRGRVIQDHMVEDFSQDDFTALAAGHPEKVSTDSDYPGWTCLMGCVPCPEKKKGGK